VRAEVVWRSRWLWITLVALIALVPIGRTLAGSRAPALRLPLPAFELTSESGKVVRRTDLQGEVWVASFIFTSCPSICPKLTSRMAELSERTKGLDDFRLVTITVDPENDTPEVLATYAKSYDADPARWTFLTGPLDQITEAVVGGFKVVLGKEEREPGIFEIVHGERVVLVDREGYIRGYYEATDEGLSTLLVDIELVLDE
jgi:protein SCO1